MHIKREQITFTGSFLYGVGPADPSMTRNGELTAQIGIGLSDDDCEITAVMSAEAARDFIRKIEAQLERSATGLIVPGNGR